jgi:hypothetical protein
VIDRGRDAAERQPADMDAMPPLTLTAHRGSRT